MSKNGNNCIICGSKRLKSISTAVSYFLIDRMFSGKVKDTQFLICKNCGINYYSLRPNDKEMANYYKNYMKEEYIIHRDKHEQGFLEWRKNYDKKEFTNELNSRKLNMHDIFKQNLDLLKVENILDYGGDRGEFILDEFRNANKYVYEISGVKPIEGITLIDKKDDLKNIKWDFILCNHVLEHVSDPMKIINHMTSLLSNEGYLYVEVPYEKYWKILDLQELLRRPRGLFSPPKNDFKMTEHINCFREKTFEHIFKRLGFEILTNKTIEQENLFGQSKIISCLVKKIDNT